MVFLKKLVMNGFKSFARKTEIPLTPGINVIIGPNGSGKSNISDALCFGLGRMSMKSMRAAKASNLIFMGTKAHSPMKEAYVELVFDNSDRGFSIDHTEIIIKRTVKVNGQSSYRINGTLQTRQDVLSLLSQAGIDPKGFNIVLQGEIAGFIKMPGEDRRKVLEEVAGISVYEVRKEKSLHELEKTDEKIKEITATLRERTAYLKNLEKEREQALKFKHYEKTVRRCKATILFKDLEAKEKDCHSTQENIIKKDAEIEKVKSQIEKIKSSISELNKKIETITEHIQKASGLEQESVRKEIANLRAELVGLTVKKENSENRLSEILHRKDELVANIKSSESEIADLNDKSPEVKKKNKQIDEKRKIFDELEEQRKKFYSIEAEFKLLKEKIREREERIIKLDQEADTLVRQAEDLGRDLLSKNIEENFHVTQNLREKLKSNSAKLMNLNSKEIELERFSASKESEIERLENMTSDIAKLDVCPLCKSKITQEHIQNINLETNPKISKLTGELGKIKEEIFHINKEQLSINDEIENIKQEISKREIDSVKLRNIENLKERIKINHESSSILKKSLDSDKQHQVNLEKGYKEFSNIDEKYEQARIDLEELSSRNDMNIDNVIIFKQRELDRIRAIVKGIERDDKILSQEIKDYTEQIKEKSDILRKREKQDFELTEKFKKILDEKSSLSDKIKTGEMEIFKLQEIQRHLQDELNNMKIDFARFDAERQNIFAEFEQYKDEELLPGSKEKLVDQLNHAQIIISQIGSVNMRALEVYDEVKKEYDEIENKLQIVTKEKEDIMKIIETIDIKKKRTFNKTLTAINELFTNNFAQLSTKGVAFLEAENKKEPFEGGINVIIKVGNGKYMDISSLSGGEQTLVALSLIFAIQEYNPYCFYILDEIDAALDKRNAERLAVLLKKYMKKGQYIVVSHNDALITEATHLYGVSMQEGVSKVVSLRIDDDVKTTN